MSAKSAAGGLVVIGALYWLGIGFAYIVAAAAIGSLIGLALGAFGIVGFVWLSFNNGTAGIINGIASLTIGLAAYVWAGTIPFENAYFNQTAKGFYLAAFILVPLTCLCLFGLMGDQTRRQGVSKKHEHWQFWLLVYPSIIALGGTLRFDHIERLALASQ